jgi:hypothetical protein
MVLFVTGHSLVIRLADVFVPVVSRFITIYDMVAV